MSLYRSFGANKWNQQQRKEKKTKTLLLTHLDNRQLMLELDCNTLFDCCLLSLALKSKFKKEISFEQNKTLTQHINTHTYTDIRAPIQKST